MHLYNLGGECERDTTLHGVVRETGANRRRIRIRYSHLVGDILLDIRFPNSMVRSRVLNNYLVVGE